MTKAFSILHRAAALLVALCLLVGMALPVYAAEDEALFFDAGSETIPTIPAETTAEESTEPEQNPVVTDSETVPGKENTLPAANEPETETETVPNNDGKAQEAAENQTPAADTDTAPADPALTNKTPADTSDTAAAPNHAINTEETTAAKTNTEQDVLFADGDNPNEEDTMLADDLPDNDDANIPDTIADTSVSTGFIPATTTIYFAVDKNIFQDSYRVHLYAHKLDDSGLDKDMVDTGKTTTDGRKIYSVTLNQADYSAGGFYRLIFQYFDGTDFKGQFFAFGGEKDDDNGNGFKKETAIDKIAGQRFDGGYSFDTGKNGNQGKAFNPDQWTRVEYYYKDTPLYFKNASGTALTNVTATFYKLENGTPTPTDSQTIGPVDAGKLAAQQIRVPDNDSRFVQFSWNDGQRSALYDFTTDYTENSDAGVQKLDLTTANCFVYDSSASSWAIAGGDLLTAGKKIYFDATLSAYSYKGEGIEKSAMPGDNGIMYCLLTGSDGVVKSQPMAPETTPTDPAPDAPANRKLWSCEIPEGTYTAVQFSTTNDQNAPAYNKTKKYSTAEIPPTLQDPCFFADDGDPTAYNPNDSRDGYWGEKDSIRDAESGKNKTGKNNPVVDIASNETFTQESGTKYITSTLYDYYTDYELNGFNRDTYPDSTTTSQRGYVTFEQFNRALSSAYEANDNVQYPLYTGHFQPSLWNNAFSVVAEGMDLYGWSTKEDDRPKYTTFMAVNNSVLDTNPDVAGNNYARTFQGLVEDTTSDGTKDGLPLLKRKDDRAALPAPYFNKDFLQGQNAFNTVLGKVYENVSFPLKKAKVFANTPNNSGNNAENDADYWYFDSNETSLYLKQDSASQGFYLAGTGTNEASHNRSYDDKTDGKGFGFFPFNQTVTGSAPQYNYGFGAKLQFDFTLTKNGQVTVGQNGETVPIQFFFSGDDDVWVYIDGELVLDVGGAHGRAAGLLEFGENKDGKNTVTSWVSDTKESGRVYTAAQNSKTVKFTNLNGTSNDCTFRYKTENPKTLKDQSTHTLTMFYMERGMWESNMALAFNFPDHNELQVEKKVDVSDVNPLFQASFKNQKIFTFNIQNLATHYGPTKTTDPTIEKMPLPETVYESATGSSATGLLSYVPSLPEKVDKDKGSAVLWESDKDDPTSKNRDKRRGTLTCADPANPINISKYSYLTFDVYVKGEQSETCALSNLYVELWDTDNKQMGCLHQKGLQSSDVYGAATALHPGQWYTVRMMLNSLQKDEHFNNQLTKITVGDNYKRSIYLRNFTFSSAPTLPEQTGFTTAQYDVPDYGSAESGKLENAAFAVFSSNFGNGDVVDENGQFLLQADEIVTFNDQFRRGSYIALKEEIDTNLYEPSWTVYENNVPVTKVNGNTSIVTTGNVPTLQGVKGTTPNDGRTENVVGESLDGHPIQNKYTDAKKPEADTLVFRSYSDKADPNELTKLKVVFNNKVKTGKLVIRKELVGGKGETLENQEFTFTVRFGDVGGQSLGGTIPEKEYICKVQQHKDGCYGEIEIDKIPVGTRFVVSEKPTEHTSLKSVTIGGIADGAVSDGMAYGTIEYGKTAKATFVNTTRKLIDITVKKEWKTQDGKTEIPQDELPNAIHLQLQRTETPDVADSWRTVESVELKKPTGYDGWVTQFTGLDKYDASKPGDKQTPYTYRVLESATGENEDWHGGAAGDVIEIGDKKYEVLNTTRVTGDSDDKTLTLTNRLQDAKYNLVITKLDAQDKSKLGDVEFKLEKLNDSGEAETTYNGVTGSDSTNQGKCSFTPLTPGNYRLTETKTAEGYTLLAEPIEFTLTADGQCKLNGMDYDEVTQDPASRVYNIALTIYNRKGFTLPHTGADAPSLWLLIGLPALVAVLLVLVFRYNKKGGRHS